ncbi:MAG: hypothetical protein H7Y86_22520 [Rhizobacter sp.]|nr:hypothetical protein [Ferruginibacter sp.]
MKLAATFILSLLTTVILAQTKDLATLPNYDCSLKRVMAIIGRQTIIVSPDKSMGLDAILNDYCATLGNNCIRKKESELTDSDFTKNLFIVGILNDFKKWELYKTPISKIARGFSVNHKNFQDSSDGLAFVDTNRIIISGNSLKAVKDAQLALTGGHDILITQNGKITFFGNRQEQKFDWFNLQNLKATNYIRKPSELFSAIYMSKTFKDTIDYLTLNKDLKLYSKQFLSIYKIKIPVRKICWFLHSNILEYGTMSGMFGLTCPGNNSAGFSIRGEIHTNGYNIGLVKHEYSHYLFDNTIPQDNNPAFFVEGCVEYVTNINDSVLFKQRIITAKKFMDTLNYADLIIFNKDFYGRYSETNYSVCGIFVKYIIDNFGVESFKKYCLTGNKQVTTKEIFKVGFDDLIKGYKSWLNKE